ncbi:hypothetical protein JCM11491_001929 [Sporobolomyces phaffii]
MSGPSPGQGSHGYYQDPAAFYDQQQGQYDAQAQHNMNTVFEEDEPVSSPELGRGDQQWTQEQYGYQQYGAEQYQAQGTGEYGYSQHHQDDGNHGYQAQPDQAPSQDQWEPPYYPGYLYDAATNSYISDPNWQPTTDDDQPATQNEQQYGDQAQHYDQQYSSYEHSQGNAPQTGQYGNVDTPEGQQPDSEFDSEDPYANDPYQLPDDQTDPYPQYQSAQVPSEATPSQEPYPTSTQAQSAGGEYDRSTVDYGDDADGSYGSYGGAGHSRDANYPHESATEEEHYTVDSNPYGPEDSNAEQDDPFAMSGQQEYDPFANGRDSYGGQNDPYSQNPESFAQQAPTAYAQNDYDSNDFYAPRQDPGHSAQGGPPSTFQQGGNGYAHERQAPPRDRSESQASTASLAQQPAGYSQPRNPVKGPSSNLRQAAASPPPPQHSANQSSYAPSPQQQQYSSFASVYDAAAQTGATEPPHDPYAPVPKQSRERAYSGASNLSNRSRPSPSQAQAQVQSQQSGPGGRQAPFDPYSRPPASLSSSQGPPPTLPPASPNMQERLPAAAPPPPTSRAAPPPAAATSRTSTFSPPPRSSSAQSNAAPASSGRSVPPPRQQGPVQQQSAGAAFDIPPPRSAAPPNRQARTSQPPRQSTSQGQPAPVAATLAPAAAPVETPRARSPSVGPTRSHESQQSTSSSTSNSSSYIPPPLGSSSTPRAPPSSQKKPSPFGGVMQPPARRAPHQRGASAFGSDSPYGALPTGPLTSTYEPSGAGVSQIKEEAEEEENLDEEPPQAETKPEEQPQEEFVPSWMQATAPGPAQRGPYSPVSAAPPNASKRDARIPPGYPSAPPPGNVDSLTDSMGQISLQGREDRRQGPPPPQGSPPPRARPPQPSQKPHQAPPHQGPPPRAQPPQQQRPAQAGGPAPPPRHVASPPSRLNAPAQNSASAPPPARNLSGRPPIGNGAPPRQQAPPRAPEQHQQAPVPNRQQPARPPVVPQLHFEPPSGEREYRPSGPTRPPPPAGQGSRSSTPVPMMVVEETAEEEEQYAQEDVYAARREQDEHDEQQRDSSEGYEVDDGPSYGESSHTATGANTPSTTYGGDWQADGYDYVSGSHSQQSQEPHKPYDPYAPQSGQSFPHDPYGPRQPYEDDEREEDSATPSVPQQATFDSRAGPPSPRKHLQQRQQPAQGRSAIHEPARASAASPAGYSPYAPTSQPSQHNESYGAYSAQQDQQPYDPYGATRHEPMSQDMYENNASSEVANLELDRRTAPLVSFGFGGRMLLVFPDGGSRFGSSSNFDPSNPYSVNPPETQQSTPSTVHIRKLADILPPPVDAPFPGPIFLDGGKANSGKKRKDAIAWLGKRISELQAEVSHAPSRSLSVPGQERSPEERELETRLLLVQLVKVFIENDGKLVGTPVVDEAVRAILAPNFAGSSDSTSLPTADQLASAASHASNGGDASPFVTYGVSGANLDEMSALLLRGERREAVRYALDHRMWAHAFIIASCVDTDCWKDVTVEFLRSELTPSSSNAGEQGVQGREALRVAYSMFAGLGAESIEQFLPPRSLTPQTQAQLLPPAPIGSSQQNRVEAQSRLPDSTLESWRDTVGMIVANRTAGDSAALTALGDALASNGWIQASHVCYLLSPQTSLVGGFGSPTSRISLVGSAPSPATGMDLESIKLTELIEFGCSLTPTVKGQEPFAGFPHLQAFRLVHASVLAESGNIPQALKYTEAVVNTLKLATRPSPFYHPRLVAQVKLLGERLGAAPGQKETSSWIARKVPRPTVNSLWSTFEGGFNKFVSGEGEATPEQLAAKAEVAKVANGQPVGPFSHFSAIAPGSNSGTLSRAQSSTDLGGGGNLQLANHPPPRPLSAAAPVPPALTSPQSNKPVHSPGPPPVKRAPFKTHHARSSSLGAFAGYDFNPTAPPPWQSYTPPAPRTKAGGEDDASAGDSSATEPPAERPKPQFAKVEDRFAEDDSGFISPMAQYTPSVSPSPGANRPAPAQNLSHRRMTTAEELADLGIGNSKSKKPAFDTLDEELEAEEGGAPPPAKSEATPNGSDPASSTGKSDDKPTIKPSKSWLGGWFKREASPAAQQVGPGPVKANLGEQKTFYYDEKLKRWVNNSGKGGDETPPAIVPPPRASTASPSRAMRGSPRFGSPAPPVPPMPPQRSQTTGPPPLSRSATSSDLRSQTQAGDFRPPSRPGSAADGPQGSRGAGGTRRNKPKYVVVPP